MSSYIRVCGGTQGYFVVPNELSKLHSFGTMKLRFVQPIYKTTYNKMKTIINNNYDGQGKHFCFIFATSINNMDLLQAKK